MEKVYISHYLSPAGEMIVGSTGNGLCICDWVAANRRTAVIDRVCRRLDADCSETPSPLNIRAIGELNEYFSGRRREFSIPAVMTGSDFQCRVWRELLNILYGTTASYAGIARRIGMPGAARAVASAIAANPISLIVPCHRVIGSNRKLTGYAGGIEAKRMLLELESSISLPQSL